ncbi:exosome-associated family [Aspergillus sp. HF37]|nr:exosome-associated family [Aspergillus sp. HF37]
MDVPDLLPQIERLDDNVDDLEEAVAPLLNQSLTETAKKLPVLDKAKLHVWTTYALENLIFCYLRLRGANAQQHPVKRELARVKQYFDKIQALETEPEQRKMAVDTQAAGRFIKHGLAGNDRFDMERKEQEAKSKARAQVKAAALAKKAETSEKPSNQARDDTNEDAADSSESEEEIIPVGPPAAEPAVPTQDEKSEKKKTRKAKHEAKAAKQHRKQDKKDKKERNGSSKERREKKLEKRKVRKAEEATKAKDAA